MPSKKATKATQSVHDAMAEANEKGYLGTVPDEVPNRVYAMPYPGEDPEEHVEDDGEEEPEAPSN